MDTLDSSKLRVALAWVAIRDTLPFTDYKLLAEWLDCYQYVLPDNREIEEDFFITLFRWLDYITYEKFIAGRTQGKSFIFKTWYYGDLAMSTLTPAEQLGVAKWMRGSNYYRTVA